MDLNVNLFSSASNDPGSADASTSPGSTAPQTAQRVIACPNCALEIAPAGPGAEWRVCPSCEKRLLIQTWPIDRQNHNAATALSDQATCFFHPDKAVQACCQRCGRFVCALCDLQLGAEHVCPTCLERGRDESVGRSEWRYRDVLYDSIALTVGWAWILFWPTLVVALPGVIFLHVKYRKAPRSYLIPRSGWRFWVAYVGLAWIPIFFASLFMPLLLRRH